MCVHFMHFAATCHTVGGERRSALWQRIQCRVLFTSATYQATSTDRSADGVAVVCHSCRTCAHMRYVAARASEGSLRAHSQELDALRRDGGEGRPRKANLPGQADYGHCRRGTTKAVQRSRQNRHPRMPQINAKGHTVIEYTSRPLASF